MGLRLYILELRLLQSIYARRTGFYAWYSIPIQSRGKLPARNNISGRDKFVLPKGQRFQRQRSIQQYHKHAGPSRCSNI